MIYINTIANLQIHALVRIIESRNNKRVTFIEWAIDASENCAVELHKLHDDLVLDIKI